MLQQTRVAAVIPYYQRFLDRFPDASTLAGAAEPEVLRLWSGLGYYSRARNLQKAADQIVKSGAFPSNYESIRELPGVGDYTAAAVASIAFGLPYAVIDGNTRRVVMRLTNNGSADAQDLADLLLDRRDPGRFNQAMMELGAVVCLPRDPGCVECPVTRFCEARKHGTQLDLPPKRAKRTTEYFDRTLLLIRRNGRVLLAPSARVKGFWDLPEPFDGARMGKKLGEFRHAITHRSYLFMVHQAIARKAPKGFRWCTDRELDEIPLSTTAKKGLWGLDKHE